MSAQPLDDSPRGWLDVDYTTPRLPAGHPARDPIPAVEDLAYVRTDSRRPSLLALIRRPSRTSQLEGLVNRYRWTLAGIRDRLRVAELRHDQTLDELTALVDEQARVLGHAHPAIVGVRAIVGEARVR